MESYINISSDNITAQCNEKCKYNIKYPSIATFNITNNNEKNIIINRISDGSVASLSNVEYTLNSIQLFHKSRLLYNGNRTDAEIVLKHTAISPNNSSLQNLEVYLPISVSSSETSDIIENIINTTTTTAPNKDETTTYTPHQPFELNQLIPKNPYYIKQVFSKQTTILAFGISDSIKISSSTLDKLSHLIKSTKLFKTDNQKLYKSNSPPSIGSAATNSNIYIDCQPINETTETVDMVYHNKTSEAKFDIDNPIVLSMIILLTFIVLIVGGNMLLKYYTSPK